MLVYLDVNVKCVVMRNCNTLDEEGAVANDSDSSPPQSRGRGRFEKVRGKVGSRGQSEDTRSTSSQAADEERSSHVRQHETSVHKCNPQHLFERSVRCTWLVFLSIALCVLAGQVTPSGQPGRWRPALWLLSRR